jgi:hypothetical protein
MLGRRLGADLAAKRYSFGCGGLPAPVKWMVWSKAHGAFLKKGIGAGHHDLLRAVK